MNPRLDLGSGHSLTIDGATVLHDGSAITIRTLTRRYPADGKVWAWLREHGFRRVSTTSGPSGETKHRVKRLVSLSPEDSALLDELAERLGCGIAEVVARGLRALSERK